MALDSLDLPTFDFEAYSGQTLTQFRNRPTQPKQPAPAKQEPVEYTEQL